MTDDFERRVRDRLRARAEPPARDLAALSAYLADLPSRQRRGIFARRTIPMSAVTGVAVVVVAAIGLGLALSSRAPTVGPSPISSVAPAPSPSLTLSPENTTWTEVQLGTMLDGGYLSAVVPFGRGFVGVGQATTPGPGAAAAWSSPDGRTWTRTATIADPLSYVSGVARSADGGTLVAIGYQADDRTMAWTSRDGVAWTAAELSTPTTGPNFAAFEIVAGESGFLVLGHYEPDTGDAWPADIDPLTPLLWQSLDGRAWTRVEIPESRIQVEAIAASGTGFLAGGARRDGSSWAPAIWTSVDGQGWSAAMELPGGSGVVDQNTAVNAIAAGPDLILAVSDRVDQAPGRVWSSTDGTTWQLIGDRGAADPMARILTWTPGGFILAGFVGDTPGEWTLVLSASADGASWTQLLAKPAPTGGNPGSLATDGSGTVLISFGQSLLVGSRSRATAAPTARATTDLPVFDLSGTAWRATSVSGQAVSAEDPPWLEFDWLGRPNGRGFTGCDAFGFGATVDAGRIAIGDLILSSADCAGPGSDVKETFLAAFRAAETWSIDGDLLTLQGSSGEITLARDLPPMGDPGRALAEVLQIGEWRIVSAPGVVGLASLAPVRFADRLMIGMGECGFSSDLRFGIGGELDISEVDWDTAGCGTKDGRPALKQILEAITTGGPGPDGAVVLSGPEGEVILGR